MAYKIRIYKRAQEDMMEFVDYINQFHEETAISYYDEVVDAINSLSDFPERRPLIRDNALRKKGYRWLQVKSHMIYFVVKGNIVQIRRILYNKRLYRDILKE